MRPIEVICDLPWDELTPLEQNAVYSWSYGNYIHDRIESKEIYGDPDMADFWWWIGCGYFSRE